MNTVESGVYLVTQENLSGGHTTREVVSAAVEAGVDVVQLREKDLTARRRLDLGRDLRELTREAGVAFLVNDRVDLALALNADGVHLGDDDLPVDVARELLGADAVVGRSVSTVEEARIAEAAGADYLGVGAVYETSSKDVDADDAEIGVERLGEVAAAVDVPVFAIGGVDASNAADVVAAGADGVAVISAITAADDVAAAARDLAAAVEAGGERP